MRRNFSSMRSRGRAARWSAASTRARTTSPPRTCRTSSSSRSSHRSSAAQSPRMRRSQSRRRTFATLTLSRQVPRLRCPRRRPWERPRSGRARTAQMKPGSQTCAASQMATRAALLRSLVRTMRIQSLDGHSSRRPALPPASGRARAAAASRPMARAQWPTGPTCSLCEAQTLDALCCERSRRQAAADHARQKCRCVVCTPS